MAATTEIQDTPVTEGRKETPVRKFTEQDQGNRLLPDWLAALIVAFVALAIPATAQADFEIANFSAHSYDSGGNVESRAGAHPHIAESVFQIPVTTDSEGVPTPDGSIKDVIVDLPAGFAGNPNKVPKCSSRDFVQPIIGGGTCPPSTRVGTVGIFLANSPTVPSQILPVYNLETPKGVPAQFGFVVISVPVYITASVRPDDHGIRMNILRSSQTLALTGTQLSLWGVPASSAHDAARGGPSDAPEKAFLSNPGDCSTTPVTRVRANSWQDPDDWQTAEFVGDPLTECDALDFDPQIKVSPQSSRADTPTGYTVELTAKQDDNPTGRATANLKKADVALPEGTAVNPSVANGLQACSEAEIGLGTDSEVACPPSSKIGNVTIDSPLQSELMKGGVYLAEQGSNPFDSTLALYLAPEGGGVQLKLAGEVAPDPQTGHLMTTFDDNPQLPFDSFVLEFKGGDRAPMVNPRTCGTKTTAATFTSWSVQDVAVERSSSFEITQGANGEPCADTLAELPFDPQMKAGLVSPVASSSSPFSLQITRPDGHQDLSALEMSLPSGLTAKLAGVDYCSDQQLAAISSAEGSGAAEMASPSCPATSQVGTATTGVGAGSSPFYAQTGKAYLAGPYKGAPLSLAVVVPAIAGPLDLGSVVVRNALHVDPRTAQITVESDPIPQILSGIPLRIKDLRINVDRPDFMRAPTDCSPKQITAGVSGSHGKSASLANRFQVGDCGSLGFSPKLKLDFGNKKKDTKRNQHPPLTANLAFNEGDANISSVQVALPEGVLLDQERISKVCSREAYAAESCPAESQVGYAKATTPLLDQPVEGPVYLKASDNVLPDLAADLNGQIDIDLFGMIDQREGKRVARIQNTFDVVPDVPVSSFELTLAGGSDGLLVNSKSICKTKRTQRVSIDMVGHNEMSTSSNPLIGSACKKINKKKAKKLKRKAAKLLRKAKKADSKKKAKKLRKQARKLKRQARKLGR